ncbi:MAG: hypothetical protein AB1591_07805, partial [Pseudomonadota bacterium]
MKAPPARLFAAACLLAASALPVQANNEDQYKAMEEAAERIKKFGEEYRAELQRIREERKRLQEEQQRAQEAERRRAAAARAEQSRR